ncbi:hypothetical protein ACIBU0_13290 [Streptomyces sp. NPDC049627]|uniref:hypothetical protein n=1 Tax=Streptomyces sp. NPDC049627 TaxID=3365595 RepID=UPI0037B093BE
MVSGLPGTGKTSALTQLGLAHELLDRARHPDVADRIPVLYITVPPAATARMIAAEFARFLGLPVRARWGGSSSCVPDEGGLANPGVLLQRLEEEAGEVGAVDP